MESDCVTFGVAIFVLLLGACSSDENDSATGGTGGFSEIGGNTLLAGQDDPTNGARPEAGAFLITAKNTNNISDLQPHRVRSQKVVADLWHRPVL